MSQLFKYFKRGDPAHPKVLPQPDGPLATLMPSSSIVAANKEVKTALDSSVENKTDEISGKKSEKSSKRGRYDIYSPEEKASIGKRAAEHGVTSTIRYYAKKYPERPLLKESSVRTWKNKYTAELGRRKRTGGDMDVTELPQKKRGRPLLLGVELDRCVQAYITALRENGAVINTAIAIACAEGIVKSHDSNLLESNGGHIHLTKFWAKYLMQRMGLVKRRASTKAKPSIMEFTKLKEQFKFDIHAIIEMEEIPPELVINWDQTGIHYIPVSNWTMALEGSKRVEIAGIDDKCQITAVFAGTMSGEFLPPQIIYKGKTSKCLPPTESPQDWHVTFIDNHWSNEATMITYLQRVLFPYIQQKRSQLGLPTDFPALVIFDRFKAQCTETILTMLKDEHIHIAIVPVNCTDRLQPLDISVNKAVKECLRRQFQQWYADQVQSQLKDDVNAAVTPIDLRMSIVKPLSLKWMIGVCDYLKSDPAIISNGFKEIGLSSPYRS